MMLSFDPHFTVQEILKDLLPVAPPKVAVAVSGGADSLALVHLVQKWAPQETVIYPLIVDHQLRPSSAEEAEKVANWLSDWGLTPYILRWQHPDLGGSVMAKSRYARYQLMALACHQWGIEHLFVGHHYDDLLETVWMRQTQGSHWRGRAGISSLSYWYGLSIFRPLLGFFKKDLENILHNLSHPWIEDPTNKNPFFQRTRTRNLLAQMEEEDKNLLEEETELWARRREEESLFLRDLYAPPCQTQDHLMIPWEKVVSCHEEQGILLLKIWSEFFVADPPPSVKNSLRFWRYLNAQFSAPSLAGPRTLGTFRGCLWIKYQDSLYIFREKGRMDPDKNLLGGVDCIWDHRFFCYGIKPTTRDFMTGPWLHRYRYASFPDPWPHENILYRPCGLGYPLFRSPKRLF